MTAQLKHYHRRAEANQAAGLTAHGRPIVRKFRTPEQRTNLAKYHQLAKKRADLGLTTRGTPRKDAWTLDRLPVLAGELRRLDRWIAGREVMLVAMLTHNLPEAGRTAEMICDARFAATKLRVRLFK